MQSNPEVSIIVPCYNQAQFLDECINSVVEQTFSNWECLIINDGSPDNTEEVAKKWVEKDLRIKYYRKVNGGISSARNYGINLALATIILPLDSDDRLGKNYIEFALPYLKNEKVKLVSCKVEMFGEKSGIYPFTPYSYKNLLIRNNFFPCSFFYKSDWQKIGGFDENMKEGLEDWEFWINLLRDGGEVVKIDSVQFYYRVKKQSMITETAKHLDKLHHYIYFKHINLYNKYYGNLIDICKENSRLKESKEYRLGKLLLYWPKKVYNFLLRGRREK